MSNHKELHHNVMMNDSKLIPVSSVVSFYELSAEGINGDMVQFSQFQGRVTLVVNIATADPASRRELFQYNEWLTSYSAKGLIVLCFPCNQFGGLEPFENDEIQSVLTFVRPGAKFVPQFHLFSKIQVNGNRAHPVYEYLKLKMEHASDEDVSISKDNHDISWNPVTRQDITGNFEKFLIAHDGHPIKRYTRKVSTETIKKDLEFYLKKIPRLVREHHGIQPFVERYM